MKRSILGIVGLTAAILPLTAPAQPVPTNPTGYLVIRVNVGALEDGSTPPGGVPPATGDLPGGVKPAPAPAPTKPNPNDLGRSVVAVVPYKKIDVRHFYPLKGAGAVPFTQNPKAFAAITPHTHAQTWGGNFLYADGTTVQVYPIREKSIERDVLALHEKWLKNRTFDGIYDLAAAALGAGMLDEATKYLDEMVKLIDTKKEANPPTRVADAARAWVAIKDKLNAGLPASGDEDRWQAALRAAAVAEGQHYSLIHWGDTAVSPETVGRRLDTLETNFRAFYLIHALLGHPMKFPEKRMLAVLADKPSDVARLRDALDGEPVTADAFYSPTHNIVVLAPERTDPVGRAFERIMASEFQHGWNRDDLLLGKAPPVKDKTTPVEITRIMTLTLADKRVELAAELGAASREGTRQLYTTLGLLPRHVDLPQWVGAGAASTQHCPHGPAILPAPTAGIAISLVPGYGMPNYVLSRKYRELYLPKDPKEKQKIPTPDAILRNLLLDKYHDAVRTGVDVEPLRNPQKPKEVPLFGGGPAVTPPVGPGPRPFPGTDPDGGPGPRPFPGPGPRPTPLPGTEEPDPQAEQRAFTAALEMKAETLAWALTYYLQKTRLAALHKFYAEFDKMPRDMKLDRNLTLIAFCKAFGLANPDGTVNEPEFRKFASAWMDAVAGVTPPGIEVPLTAFMTDVKTDPGVGGPMGTPNP